MPKLKKTKMKAKYLMILFLGAITLVACKKDRTCECEIKSDGSTYDYESDEYKKVTKRFMRIHASCVSYESEDSDGDKYEVECEIK